jgi:hypothetical protein
MLESNPSYQPHRHLEPFGEPRTMAVQWDLSSLVSPASPAARTIPSGIEDAELVEASVPAQQEDESNWDKFPQPATIPAGWDLSELFI